MQMEQPQTSALMDPDPKTSKPPIVRGARACTVCRAAKMKCVGAEDGQPCQRCRRANVECVFEKHRRGRKPGSRLSEASKMLRRLEKGLNNAKIKAQHENDARMHDGTDSSFTSSRNESSSTYFPSNQLPPLNMSNYHGYRDGRPVDEEEADGSDGNAPDISPANLIRKENQRHSFFHTILNHEQDSGSSVQQQPLTQAHRRNTDPASPYLRPAPVPSGLEDPLTSKVITEEEARDLFDMFFLRLNPFVNLFDPSLHTVAYVRSKSPFLFTAMIMAACKFFKHEHYKTCQKLANELAIRAFADMTKSVEVVQAFACLVYWREPDDQRTWTFIGYACRMAVELGLNRYIPKSPAHETEFQRRERRNRERTYLVLFVHDRALAMQTGRHWMLPEDDIVRNASNWHEAAGPARPEDVILCAFVNLRRIAAETRDMFTAKQSAGQPNADVDYDVVLRSCNAKLTTWTEQWRSEMERAGGDSFHLAFMNFFKLYDRLFLNSFGIQGSMVPNSRVPPGVQALSMCYQSAMEILSIVSHDFVQLSMLRYAQDSITIMTAYSAVLLLKLLRSPNTFSSLQEGATENIYALISRTADAYQEVSVMSPASTSAAHHSRFLRNLIAKDRYIARQNERERMDALAQQQQASSSRGYVQQSPAHEMYSGQGPSSNGYSGYSSYPPAQMQQQQQQPQAQYYPPNGSPRSAYPDASRSTTYQDSSARMNGYHAEGSARGGVGASSGAYSPYGAPMPPQHQTESDAHYWKHMFAEIGYPESSDDSPSQALPSLPPQHAQPQQHHSMSGHVMSPLEAQPPRSYIQPGQQQQQQQNGYAGYHQHVEQGAPRSMAAYDHRM